MRCGIKPTALGIRLTKVQSLLYHLPLLAPGQLLLYALLFSFVNCDYSFLTYKVAVRIK